MMTATVTEINSLINEIKGVQFRIEKWEAIASFFRILEGEDVEEFRPKQPCRRKERRNGG